MSENWSFFRSFLSFQQNAVTAYRVLKNPRLQYGLPMQCSAIFKKYIAFLILCYASV